MRRSSNPPPPVFPALLDLYLSGSLADVCLIAGDGEEEEEGRSSSNSPIRAHKAVLAASSGYFRALFAGAGASMMTTTTTATTTATTTTTTEEERGGGATPLPTVRLPSLTRKQLEAVLEWIYSCGERVAFFKRGRARQQRRGGGTTAATAAAAAADRRRRNAGTTERGEGLKRGSASSGGEDEEEDEAAEERSTAAAGLALAAADFLDVPRLRAAALAALRSRLRPRTALGSLALAASCGDCGDLYAASLAMAQARFSEVVVVAAAAASAAASGAAAAAAAASHPSSSSAAPSPPATPPPPPASPPPPLPSSPAPSAPSYADAAAARALASLPPHALLDLLRGDALDARDEAEVLCVAMSWCDAVSGDGPSSSSPSSEESYDRRAWAPQLLGCCRASAVDLAASARVLSLLHPERASGGTAANQPSTSPPPSSSSPLPPPFAFSRGTREAFADALSEAAAGPARPPPPPRGFGGADGGGGAAAAGGGSFLGACFSGRTLVACGGHDDGWRPFRSTEIYDPVVDEWSPGPTAPSPLPFAAAAVRLVFFGVREREGKTIFEEKEEKLTSFSTCLILFFPFYRIE